jgi:hypothetical protein
MLSYTLTGVVKSPRERFQTMANVDRVDPKTRRPLFYHPEKRSLSAIDETICYPVINGIPRFVAPGFYQRGGLALPLKPPSPTRNLD